jgi:hypothetical protein
MVGTIFMLRLHNLYIRLGTSLADARPALPLNDDMPGLTEHYRHALRNDPDHFKSKTQLEGFAPVKLEFTSLCQTVAMVVVEPQAQDQKTPDAVCLFVNGLEAPEDVAAVKAKVNFPPFVWAQIDQSEKPVAVNVFYVNGRMREPATISVLHALANCYFAQFGTTEVEDDVKKQQGR